MERIAAARFGCSLTVHLALSDTSTRPSSATTLAMTQRPGQGLLPMVALRRTVSVVLGHVTSLLVFNLTSAIVILTYSISSSVLSNFLCLTLLVPNK